MVFGYPYQPHRKLQRLDGAKSLGQQTPAAERKTLPKIGKVVQEELIIESRELHYSRLLIAVTHFTCSRTNWRASMKGNIHKAGDALKGDESSATIMSREAWRSSRIRSVCVASSCSLSHTLRSTVTVPTLPV